MRAYFVVYSFPGDAASIPDPKQTAPETKVDPVSVLESSVSSALKAMQQADSERKVSAGILAEVILSEFLDSVLQTAIQSDRAACEASKCRQEEYINLKAQLNVLRKGERRFDVRARQDLVSEL